MRDFKINWAVILAFMVLLIYTYISFLGALYIFQNTDAPLLFALLAAIAQIVIVSTLVVVLCIAKASRWKKSGFAGQVVFGGIILVLFMISGVAFSRFLDASARQEAISEEIDNIKESAKNMKVVYREYVNQRVIDFQQLLPRNSTSDIKVQSLKFHLLPNSLNECETNRDEWLDDFGEMSVWDIRMPDRLNVLSLTVNDWQNEYANLSMFSYSINNIPFEYNEFEEQLTSLTNELMPDDVFGNLHIRWWVCILALIAVGVMLLPYFITEGFIGGKPWRLWLREKLSNGHIDSTRPYVIVNNTDVLTGQLRKRIYYYE